MRIWIQVCGYPPRSVAFCLFLQHQNEKDSFFWRKTCLFLPPPSPLLHPTEPVPAYSSPQRDGADREEPRLSPHAGGFLIRQLLEEDSDPMLSPRFYAYGQCQQYLSDTEVPPSPPNAHSFVR